MKNNFLPAILLFLLSVFSLQVHGSYYYFKQISIKQGLPSSVTTIYDDENGFLWIGTIYGLYRFDGEKLKKFPFSNELETSPYIYSVKSDSEGHIWIFTSQGVSLYNPMHDTLEPFLLNGSRFHSYTVLSEEKYIVFPIAGELLRYDKQLNTCTRLPVPTPDKQEIILKMEVYDAHHYLALTNKQTLLLIDRGTGETKASPFKTEHPVWSFYRDSANRYWFSHYGKGVSCFTPQGDSIATYTPLNSNLNNTVILDIEERNKQIWLATDGGGINIIHPETRQITILSNQQNSQFPANSVTCLSNGTNNMWIGMVREGVLGAKENFITTYSKSSPNDASGMSEKCPLCLLEDTDGTIWIGTDGGGVNSFNPETEKFTHYPATSGEKIVSLCAYSKDELLISNYLTGLHIFNKNTGTYRKFTIMDNETDRKIVGSDTPINLFVNRQEEIELQGGIYCRYSKEKNRFFPLNMPQGEYNGSWIYIGDYQSKPYFHNQNRIFRYNRQTDQTELVYKATNRYIIAARIDPAGVIWIANRNNLSTLNVNTCETERLKLPDNNDIVTSLVIDRQGTVWMGTPGALYSYSPKEKRFVIFSESDGVLPNDFLPKAVLVTHDDNIYMGGAMGLMRVNKAFYKDYNPGNKLRLTLLDTQLNGTNIAPDHSGETPGLNIPSSFTSLVIHTKLDGTDLFRKRIYRYQIEGLNNNFTESSKSYLMIQTLPAGDYRIHVQCTMADGSWSEPFAILNLTVSPPWWQRTWFILLAGLLAILGLAYLLHLREIRLQRNLKEKERQIYKDKVQALININHELHTPLTLIYSPLKQLLNSKQMPYELRNKLQGVLKQTRQMKNIINMILNMRRMEVGRHTLHLMPTPLNPWLENIINDFKSEFEIRHISLLFKPDPLIGTLSFDVNQCEIIISNLLMNAYKFSNPDSTVTVSSQRDGDFIRIHICDEGIGLGDENPEKLFTRFQRGDHSIEGNGIGLSYAKQLVEMHGGQIGARNNEEKGATFFFTLPVRQEANQVECPAKPYLNEFLPFKEMAAKENKSMADVRFHSVLIVEDDPDLCDFMAANLQSIFATVYIAHDGMEALPIVASRLPQLIISDLTLPRLSGLDLCRRVKQSSELNFIPVILLAPDMDEMNAEDVYKTGVDAYVVKPFDIDLLIIQVQTLLNNRNIIRKHYLTAEPTGKPITETSNYIEEQFVIHLNKVITDNLSNTELDVNRVAQLMHMSRASLYNKMKVIIGTGVNEYITKQRIRYAEQQLVATSLSIREISEKAGFQHQRNFSTTFKNLTGLSPSDYRKSRQEIGGK